MKAALSAATKGAPPLLLRYEIDKTKLPAPLAAAVHVLSSDGACTNFLEEAGKQQGVLSEMMWDAVASLLQSGLPVARSTYG